MTELPDPDAGRLAARRPPLSGPQERALAILTRWAAVRASSRTSLHDATVSRRCANHLMEWGLARWCGFKQPQKPEWIELTPAGRQLAHERGIHHNTRKRL